MRQGHQLLCDLADLDSLGLVTMRQGHQLLCDLADLDSLGLILVLQQEFGVGQLDQ